MPSAISSPPDVEAHRDGVPPAAPDPEAPNAGSPAARRAAALALLDSWRSGTDAEDQRQAGEALTRGLDEARPGQRPHFPPELKGVTW